MSDIVKLKIPEPIEHDGRERFLCGWNTAGIGQWLIRRKLGERATELSEIATVAYGRDSPSHRQSVSRNVSSLRRWLADHNEFLLTIRGHLGRTIALKICDPSNSTDRQMAEEQLIKLEARSEITEVERRRWEQMLRLGMPATAQKNEDAT